MCFKVDSPERTKEVNDIGADILKISFVTSELFLLYLCVDFITLE